MADYVTAAELRLYAGISSQTTDAALTQMIKGAQRLVDRRTRTWWDKRSVVVTFSLPSEARYLWLPAPFVSVTSLTEGGVALSRITSPGGSGDYYTKYDHIEKVGLGYHGALSPPNYWTTEPNGIVFTGELGYDTVLDDVKQLTMGVAAAIGKLDRRTYVNDDGSVAEVIVSQFPAWIEKDLARMRMPVNDQVAIVTAVP